MSFLAALPGIAGIIGSLFGGKGKQTQYTGMQNPQQAEMLKRLLAMGGQRMGQQSAGMQPGMDAMNMLYSTFFGRPYQPQQQRQIPVTNKPVMGPPGDIPSYAQGGIAWQPQIAQLGERGPEAVVPLQNMMGQMGGAMGAPMPMGQPPPMGGVPGMMGAMQGQMGGGQQMSPNMQNQMGQMRGQMGMGQQQQGMNPQMQNMMGQMGGQMPGGNTGMPGGLQALIAQLMRRRAGGMGMGQQQQGMARQYGA